jgi:hypothetical protein
VPDGRRLGCTVSAMDGGDSGGGGFGWGSNGGAEPPGPGIPYGWFLVVGGFLLLMAGVGTLAVGLQYGAVGAAVLGLVIIAAGIYEWRHGTPAWDRD